MKQLIRLMHIKVITEDFKTRILNRVLVIVAIGVRLSDVLDNPSFGTPSTTLMVYGCWLLSAV